MKKFISVFFVFLFLIFNINVTIAFAQQPKSLTQGFYKVKDTGLLVNAPYKVKNISSSGRVIIEVFDGNQQMQEFIRVEPNSPEYYIKPLGYDSIIVIIGNGEVMFT
jgi:hypothetical protein